MGRQKGDKLGEGECYVSARNHVDSINIHNNYQAACRIPRAGKASLVLQIWL